MPSSPDQNEKQQHTSQNRPQKAAEVVETVLTKPRRFEVIASLECTPVELADEEKDQLDRALEDYYAKNADR